MIQTATAPEQSERLLQLGVPASTADMEYCMGALRVKRPEGCADNDSVKTPAWSLSALLALIPADFKNARLLSLSKSSDYLYVSCYGSSGDELLANYITHDPIEGIVLVIGWLVTNGYILNTNNNEND